MVNIELSKRQKKIINIVKENQPITSDKLAEKLNLTRSTLRPDLAVLTMIGILDARPKVGYFFTGNSSSEFISDKIKKIKVKDIKSLPVVIDEQASLYETIITLFLEDTGTVYVLSNGYLAGVVSRKDLLKSIMGGSDINKVPVGLIMTRMPNIILVNEEDTALDAAIRIIEHEVDSLPVVEKIKKEDKTYYKVKGKVSKTNITRLYVEMGIMKDKEEI